MKIFTAFFVLVSLSLCSGTALKGQVIVKLVPPDLEAFIRTNSCEMILINRNDSCLDIFLSLSLTHETDSCEWIQLSKGLRVPPLQRLDINWDTLGSQQENQCIYHFPLKGLFEFQVLVKEKKSLRAIAVDRLQMYLRE